MIFNILKNKILCFVGISLLIPSLFLFWPFKKKQAQQQSLKTILDEKYSSTNDNAEIIIKNLILKEIEKHKKLEVIVNASEGKILNSTDKIECKNITCALKNQNKQIADLHSKNAIIKKNTKDVLLSGSTIGRIYDMTIQGCDISFSYSAQTLTTKQETQYTHKNFKLSAKKSLVDIKKNIIYMSNGIQSEILNSPTGNSN